MIANRKKSHHRHGSIRRQRNLVVGFGAATAVGFSLLVAFIVFGRPAVESPTPSRTAPPIASPATGESSTARERQAKSDQRISATRKPRSLGDSDEPGSDPLAVASPMEPPREPAESAAAPEQPKRPDADSAPVDPKNPRSLLRQARKQIRNGQTKDALATSRQIAAVVGDGDRSGSIGERVREAEAAFGAGQLVDFDSLIQLIEQVVAPNSWSSVGGAGTIQPFPDGVYIDTAGLVQPRAKSLASNELDRIREKARPENSDEPSDRTDGLRLISLPRLEAQLAQHIARGQAIPDEMRYLAGLQEIRYLLVYPEEHDIVVAGPAEPWKSDEFGRVIGTRSGRPVLQLDDLLVIVRACFSNSENHGLFGCGIYPRTARLQQVQEFLARSAAAGPIEPSQRDRWLAELRDQLGPQDVEIFGIHPGSRVAQVLVEADYRMKLIGIGLEPAAVAGIPSYFELIGQPDAARLNGPMETLRWWFMLNYDTVLTNQLHDAFELRGSRAQVLSENELLTATGQRVHTGQSDPINAQFAKNFTDHFQELAAQDVNFADLAGIFDLAVLGGLLRGYDLPRTTGWEMATILDPDESPVALNPPPRTVETVINHRVYRGQHIKAVISGGVHVNPWTVVGADRLVNDGTGKLQQLRIESHSRADVTNHPSWWWDH